MRTPLSSIDSLKGFELSAHDGAIGKCTDFLFDDQTWVIRYLVADTRKWLPGRKVLISPISIGTVDPISLAINIGLSKEQIKNAPPLDSDAPVSRKYEIFFNQYYDWSDYWRGPQLWGAETYPRDLRSRIALAEIEGEGDDEPRLRSIDEVSGYRVHARDDDIGHVEDVLVEEDTWRIRYLVIDTGNWLPGSKRVIIDPNWVDNVNWSDRSVAVRMTREQIESSPEYDHHNPIFRDYEKSVFDHYKFPYYWI